MSTIFIFKPCSQETRWLTSLSINPGLSRVQSTLNKLTKLFYQSRDGGIVDILTIFTWYQIIKKIDRYFDKEIVRLSKLIKRKCKDQIIFEPEHKFSFRLRVTTPPAAAFYRLLGKHDTLMCLVETCVTLKIFKKRRTHAKKSHAYTKGLLELINMVGEYKISSTENRNIELSDTERNKLALAIDSDVMPIFRKVVRDHLISLISVQTV
ncbi:MAG: hypothetical protein KIT27_10230 [Legionellales bacterium]|nr:hypothetical protein [Legionellales bacterium]